MKRNDSDIKLVKSMVVMCCALHNLCESHREDYRNEWDAPVATAAEETVVAQAQGAEEGRDVSFQLTFNTRTPAAAASLTPCPAIQFGPELLKQS